MLTRSICAASFAVLLSLSVQAQEPTAEGASSDAASSQSSSSSSEAPLYPSRDIRDKTLIANAAGEQAQWLDTEYGKLLVFYRPTEARKTQGVLILFHAAEDPQTWPPALENLRANLPRYGWETLAVSLPQQYLAPVPLRPSSSSASSAATPAAATEPASAEATSASSAASSETSQAASSSSSIVARDIRIQAYVAAAFQFLQDKGQAKAIVLVDNSSANPVLQQLLPQIKQDPANPTAVDGPVQALIIANLQSQEQLNTSELTALFANRQLPVLDIFFSPELVEQTRARDLHRAVAMRQKLDNYQQALLDNPPKISETDSRSFLAARIRGFMQKHLGSTAKDTQENNAGTTTQP